MRADSFFLTKQENQKKAGWKCVHCEQIFRTRKELYEHVNLEHTRYDENGKRLIWNKGLTKENSDSLKRAAETYRNRIVNGEIIPVWQGKKLPVEIREKIAAGQRKYYSEHPEEIPYVKYGWHKQRSYPEVYFKEWLDSEHVEYTEQFKIGRYHLDFKIGMVDLEIDGQQHYRFERYIKSDKIRNKFLEENGYTVIRVNWGEYSKLDSAGRSLYLGNLLTRILNQNTNTI